MSEKNVKSEIYKECSDDTVIELALIIIAIIGTMIMIFGLYMAFITVIYLSKDSLPIYVTKMILGEDLSTTKDLITAFWDLFLLTPIIMIRKPRKKSNSIT